LTNCPLAITGKQKIYNPNIDRRPDIQKCWCQTLRLTLVPSTKIWRTAKTNSLYTPNALHIDPNPET
jgi:hypothetical protein